MNSVRPIHSSSVWPRLALASCSSKATISPRAETATSPSRRRRLTESSVRTDSSRPREWASEADDRGEHREDHEEEDRSGQRQQLLADHALRAGSVSTCTISSARMKT